MKKKEIEENFNLTKTLLEQWLGYRKFYKKATSEDPITTDEENAFLELRTQITRTVRTLSSKLNEKQHPFAKDQILELLKSTTTVSHLRDLQDEDRRQFYKKWHEAKIYLSRTVGEFTFLNDGYVPPQARIKKKKKKGKGGPMKAVLIVVVIAALAGGAWFVFQNF